MRPKVTFSPNGVSVSVLPGTSSTSITGPSVTVQNPISDSDSDEDEEVCCVCNRRQPPRFSLSTSVMFVPWGQCSHETCKHWVHLAPFCSKISQSQAQTGYFECPCHCEE